MVQKPSFGDPCSCGHGLDRDRGKAIRDDEFDRLVQQRLSHSLWLLRALVGVEIAAALA
ncbi:hypothetical protein D3C71_2189590 [compost metagenome]